MRGRGGFLLRLGVEREAVGRIVPLMQGRIVFEHGGEGLAGRCLHMYL